MIKEESKISSIKKDFMSGKTYNQIAEKHKVTYNEVLYLARKQKWKRESNLSKAKKGNKNAKGNKGGIGAKKGNKNAVTTGAYETIYDDLLTDDEKQIIKQIEIEDKKKQLLSEIKILTIRERRIFAKIKKLEDGEGMSIVKEFESTTNDAKNKSKYTATEKENTISIIQKLEEALTRIQEAKRRYIDSYHKIETDNRKLELDLIRLEMEATKEDSANNAEEIKDDSFIKALNEATEKVWQDHGEDS